MTTTAQICLPTIQQVSDRLRELYHAHPRRSRKRLTIAQLNEMLDSATDRNWRVQYLQEPYHSDILVAIFIAIISVGLLIPFLIIAILSPPRVKLTATLSIPTLAGQIDTRTTVVRSHKIANRDALNLAIQQFFNDNNVAAGSTTAGRNYTGP